ncbi:TolC family protein [Stenotrophomonas maltophilia]|uniref:TolC family protein n=1 Tax=Stenotrophomonas maltophilia TaxID=40324 RepID=A0AAI9C856_STEMA|nr:TolC family protein [Stenotrophomonas maltophilia]MBN5013588.1 TolC family protein [Stenotrophomonas maltophilia]
MKFLSPCAAAVLACIPWWALAQEPAPQWLPPPDQVHATLQAQPTVRAAAERLQAAAATQRALEVGSHEFQANSGLQRRNVTTEQRRYNEWELGISRTIRLPGKARLDREIGSSTRSVAELRLEDAEHQVARRLLDAWMGWLRSSAVAEETAAQDQLLSRERDALARRVTLGDAARREMDVLDAERATQAAQTLMARDAALAARQTLALGFPEITVPPALPALPEPQELPDGPQAWQARIVRESAEIAIANGETTRLFKVAERTRAERTPDPTVGVRVLSDRGGTERVVGVVLSIPFGTDYRSARAATESANAAAAEAEAADVRRAIEQGAWLAVQAAQSKRAQWQSHQQALAAQVAANTRTRRAWELGEAPLGEYLLSLRSLRQARLAETQARVDALQAAMLVRIDAHAMWHSEGEGHGENSAHAVSP